jgi:DNA-binding PucR family transcriptional regulator
LLHGTASPQVAAEILGLGTDRPAAVIAFVVAAGRNEGDASAVVAAQRVADLAAVYCESYRRQAACAATGDRVYLLAPVEAGQDLGAAVTLAEAIVERAQQALRLSVRAGIGQTAGGPDGVREARQEADQVLEVVRREPELRVGTIGALRAQVILRRLVDLAGEDRALLAGRVAALAEQDASKGTTWIPTLRAYFDAFGDMAAAAARVNVHPNTFRYRLRRITEVFGLDLDDPDERLVAELQLRFLDAER